MVSDLTTEVINSATLPAADSSRQTPERRASSQPLRPWSTPRLLRLSGDGTEKITGLSEHTLAGRSYGPGPS